MGLVSTWEMIKDWLRGGLSTSSKGKVPPQKKRGWSKVCFGGMVCGNFQDFRGGLNEGAAQSDKI